MRLVLLRHGETEWSAAGRHTGRTDVPLTAAGEAAARGVGLRLAGLGLSPGRRLSSPRRRALDTARLAGLGNGLETTEQLAEVGYGECEGRTTADIRRDRPGWDFFRDGCPGGESLAAAGRRADGLLARLAPDDPGDVALVGHGHFLRVVAVRYLGLDLAAARHLYLGTASISVLGPEHEWPAVLLWNDQGPVAR